MIITTHPVPPYPRFLPNQETLVNQATGSSPPKKVFKQSRQKSVPLWGIKQTERLAPQNLEIFSKMFQHFNKDY